MQSPQNLKINHFKMVEAMELKVNLNGMTSLTNFTKIYQLVQKLMGGQTHRQHCGLIGPHFFFL
jgi:hypothetical protein